MAAPATKGDIKTIFEKLNKISRSLVDNSSSLAQLHEEIRELKKSQPFLSEQYGDVKEKLHWKNKEVKDLQVENRSLKEHVQKLEVQFSHTEEDLNDLEQYGRHEYLEFQVLAWKENENTDDLLVGVCKLLDVDLDRRDISVSHRLAPATESNQQPTIIARFCSRKVRDSIFSQRHRLHSYNRSHPKARMFINESLTKTNRQRFNQCLRYKNEKSFKYIWTKQGNTFLRQTEGSPVIAIKTESKLSHKGN